MTSTITTPPPASKVDSIINSINANYNKSVQSLVNSRNVSATSILNSRRLNINSKRMNIQILNRNFRFNLSRIANVRAESIKSYRSNYKALLVGCNYRNTRHELTGCIKDVDSIKTFLSTKGINEQSMFTMTDDSNVKPTKDNIIQAFTDLLERSVSGETVVFVYSGHGSLIDSKNQTHEDNVIISLDLQKIVDNEFNAIIKTHLKKDVTLFALFDCCHSRTMFDLHYNYDISANDYFSETSTEELPANTDTDTEHTTYTPDPDSTGDTDGQVFFISGCLDNQVSVESRIEGITQGAMTWAYLKTMNENNQLSWKKLISIMRNSLKDSAFTQIPQFSTGIKCDLNSICLYSL